MLGAGILLSAFVVGMATLHPGYRKIRNEPTYKPSRFEARNLEAIPGGILDLLMASASLPIEV
jgi:hypothetical protein